MGCFSSSSARSGSGTALIDRLLIDEYWVGHTKAWEIPGTQDMKPYINTKDKIGKWLMGTVGFAILSAILAGILSLLVK